MIKQPDGYCAWHPEKGPDLKSLRKAPHSSYYRHSILLEGWQIKPVWISTEPPVSKELLEKLLKGLKAVEDLIAKSAGVLGLHLNGDLAYWEDLRSGGKFEEWLNDFDAALSEQDHE